MKKNPTLSLIIPAYNEEKIIKDNLKKAIEELNKTGVSWELICVDDGSSDKTPDIVKKIKKVKLISYAPNRGKGAALKEGFLHATGDFAIYSDADLSVDLKYIKPFLKELKSFDVVIASRRVEGSEISVHQPLIRETLGRGYTLLTQLMMGMNIKDFTCGFKGFNKKAYKKIFANSKINRWAYDSEVLFLAKKYKFSIKQFPIKWINRQDSRVKLKNVILESFVDLVKIRLYDANKNYE